MGLNKDMGEEPNNWPDAVMEDGWPQVPPEWWGEPGMHVVGLCTGPVRDVGGRGATVELNTTGEHTIFPRPVQTQFIIVVEDGALRMEAYDPKRHGKIGDIPLMETSPPQLLEQLYGDSGTQEKSEGQQFANTRRGGASRTHWSPRHHPKPRHG